MASLKDSVTHLVKIPGAISVAIIDLKTGHCLGCAGENPDVEVEAAANAEILNAKRRALRVLGKKDSVEDMLITTARCYYLLRLFMGAPETMIYLQLNRRQANLAMARFQLRTIEEEMVI